MKNILVVESERPIEGLAGALFKRRECVLQVASSGAEALATAEQVRPDLVLYDALVEDFSAEEFAQALHSSRPGQEVPVIAVLDDESAEQEGRILRAGAAAVLRRPIDEIQLNVKVCELLGISLRRHVRTLVKLKVDTTVGSTVCFATISNISLGGVRIETDRKLNVGEFIKLQFSLPGDDQALTIIGRVLRGDDSDGVRSYGCHFMDLTDDARERIHDFVSSAETAPS